MILQGYENSKITILTTYSGQLAQIRREMQKYDLLDCVRIAVVDDYQGEENDIIIISMVRSNNEGDIGFLQTPNRVNVALSRAKKALYCVGNFDCLTKGSKLWQQIIEKVKAEEAYGDALMICCQKHTETKIKITKPMDFEQTLERGCLNQCQRIRVDCGHLCTLTCHITDLKHELTECLTNHNNTICEREQQCPNSCSSSGLCNVIMEKNRSCGHVVKAECYMNPENCTCSAECIKMLPCGHEMEVRCCDLENSLPECKQSCDAILSCGHRCSGTCLDCYRGRLHTACQERCSQVLACGHKCLENCADYCQPCKKKCVTKCFHTVCRLKCYQTCESCMEPCVWQCEHLQCNKLCSEPCDREICSHPCKKRLPCGHNCVGICGEPCPGLCRYCNKEYFKEYEDEPDAKFLRLDCNHPIEINEVLKWVAEITALGSIQAITCPECKIPIGRSNALKKYTLPVNAAIKKNMSLMNNQAECQMKRVALKKKLQSIKFPSLCNSEAISEENRNRMKLIHENLLVKFKHSNLNIRELRAMENKLNNWQKITEYFQVYKLCETVKAKFPNIISDQTFNEIEIRLRFLIEFLSKMKHTEQEQKDFERECMVFDLSLNVFKVVAEKPSNDPMCSMAIEFLNATLKANKDSDELINEMRSLLFQESHTSNNV